MISSISAGIPSIFIFLLVGVLISVWIAAGTIPTLMVYGFQLVSQKFSFQLFLLFVQLLEQVSVVPLQLPQL